MLVVRPTEAYHSFQGNALVWLAAPKPATSFRAPRHFLANLSGRVGVGAPYPALATERLERPMRSYPLSEKLSAVRDSLTDAELTLFTQERADSYAAIIYQQGVIDGQAKLIQSQRDQRERRKVGRGKKEWVTVIYFICSPSAVKIGMAKDAQRRLGVLQTSHPETLALVATCEGGRQLEGEYHRRFAEHRLRGEWFSRAPEILAEIARLSPSQAIGSNRP